MLIHTYTASLLPLRLPLWVPYRTRWNAGKITLRPKRICGKTEEESESRSREGSQLGRGAPPSRPPAGLLGARDGWGAPAQPWPAFSSACLLGMSLARGCQLLLL